MLVQDWGVPKRVRVLVRLLLVVMVVLLGLEHCSEARALPEELDRLAGRRYLALDVAEKGEEDLASYR